MEEIVFGEKNTKKDGYQAFEIDSSGNRIEVEESRIEELHLGWLRNPNEDSASYTDEEGFNVFQYTPTITKHP
jgi:hypothetical protein